MKTLESVPTAAASLGARTCQWNRYLEMVVKGVLWVYLASLPFRALLVIERNGFLLLLSLLLLWSLSSRRLFYRPTPMDLPLLAFVGWVAFTIPFAHFPGYSLKEFGKLAQGVLVFYAILYFLHGDMDRKRLVYLFMTLTGLVSLYGIIQYDPLNQQAMTSFLPSEVWLTTYLVLCLPLCVGIAYSERHPYVRTLAIAVSMTAAASLILTRSRAGSLALIVEMILLAWLFRRCSGAVLGLMAGLLVVGGLWVLSLTPGALKSGAEVIPMNKSTSSIVHRLDIWKFTLTEIPRHLLVGIGYGKDNFLLVYGESLEQIDLGHAPVKNQGVHNILLYHALHVGIPGAILFIWVMIRAVKVLYQGVKQSLDRYSYGILAGILTAVVGGLVRFQFDLMLVGTLSVLFWALLAVGMIHLPAREERSPLVRS